MTFGQPQPRPAVPAATAGKRSHARNVTLLRQLLVIGLGLALLGGLSAPLVFMGQGSAQAATQLRSGEYCDGLRAACTQTFATWRGQAVRSTLTFLPDSSWATIEGPDWWFKAWQVNPYASMAVVTIPMLPAQGTSTDPTPTLVTGATGAYNAHWKIVAQRLVATGMGAVTIRPGHELSGDWYRWSAGKNPAAYAAYWRQIVTTMRSVTGAKFSFDWNVAVGTSSWDATLAWPGDAYVDSVGQDVYDVKWGDSTATPAARFTSLVEGSGKFRQGMAFWANFATAHGKPVSFAEWALVASGASMSAGGEGKDDPYYIQHMHDWFTTHPTAFEIYFDRTATDGDHQLNGGKFPQAAALYRQLFAAPSTTPTASADADEVRIRHAEQHRNAEQHADGDPVQHGPHEFERNGVEHRVDHRFQQRLGHGVGRPVRLRRSDRDSDSQRRAIGHAVRHVLGAALLHPGRLGARTVEQPERLRQSTPRGAGPASGEHALSGCA